jgi:hypothetical protein
MKAGEPLPFEGIGTSQGDDTMKAGDDNPARVRCMERMRVLLADALLNTQVLAGYPFKLVYKPVDVTLTRISFA